MGSSVYADIYMYIDEDGVMHFTNAPTSNEHEYKIYIKEKTSQIEGRITFQVKQDKEELFPDRG